MPYKLWGNKDWAEKLAKLVFWRWQWNTLALFRFRGILVTFREGEMECQGAQSARVKGTYSGGGRPSWVTKYSNSKAQMSLWTTYYLYLDPKKLSTWTIPTYTDGSNALRVVTSTLTGSLITPLPQSPPKKLLQEGLNSVCRLPKSPSLFFFSSNSTQFIHLPLIPWFFGKTTTISGKGFWQIFRAQYTHLGIFIRANTTSAAKRCVCVLCRKRREDAGWPGWNPPYPGCISSSIIFISPAFLGMTPRATM